MYIEGFLIPVPTDRKDDYLRLAKIAAEVFLEHGATRIVETWGDGLDPGEHTSFPRAVQLEEGENVVLSWIEFPDKPTREAAHEKVFADQRMQEVMEQFPADGKRMVFGGFTPLMDVRKHAS